LAEFDSAHAVAVECANVKSDCLAHSSNLSFSSFDEFKQQAVFASLLNVRSAKGSTIKFKAEA
tara:strand:+ start:1299 stop:1487 length:189 start_codon:yes stop_codon:yes gene_type:complete